MELQISIRETSVTLGNPVTITYYSEGFADTTLTVDNYPNGFDLGGSTVSGTMKILPLTDGTFNVTIKGSGIDGAANDYLAELTKSATCTVI